MPKFSQNSINGLPQNLQSLVNADAAMTTHLSSIDALDSAQSTHLNTIDVTDSAQETHLTTIDSVNNTQNSQLTMIETSDSTQNTHLTNIDSTNATQDTHLSTIDATDTAQNIHLSSIDATNTAQNSQIATIQALDTTQNTHLSAIDITDSNQNTHLTTIDAKNVTQDSRLTAIETWDLDPVLPKDLGRGIKVDLANPTWAWKDLTGRIGTRTGTTAPTWAAFRGGNCQKPFFSVNDQNDIEYHLPHDLVPNSDLFLHLHWGHNGTAISGNLVIQVSMTWAKGHNQDIFTVEKVFNLTIPATNLTVAPRWGHIVSEVQISAASPTVSQFNSNIFEPDGELVVNTKVITNPAITGGSTNTPYWGHLDLHYQSTGRGTKNKAPNFNV
jgi:hypothetical protein